MRPRVLLLDEPAAGLMRADKDALSELLRRIADLGITVILVEHDMMLVMGISDHVVVLDAGQCIAERHAGRGRAAIRACSRPISAARYAARPRDAPGTARAIRCC